MNKNSILAVVLSGLVLFTYVFFSQQRAAKMKAQETQVQEQPQTESVELNDGTSIEISEAKPEEEEVVEEQSFVIETNKLKVTFTNRGGDVTSLELLEHNDNKTKQPVQMAENISDTNRAFALNLGPANKTAVNDFFMVKEFPVEENGEKKIAFAKKYEGYTLVKQYTFMPDDYVFKMNIIIDGNENFRGIGFDGEEKGKVAYTLRTSPQIGPFYDKKKDRYEHRSFLNHTGNKFKQITMSDNQFKKFGKEFTWVGIGGKYFCELIIPEKPEMMLDAYYSSAKSNFEMTDAQALIMRKEITDKKVNDGYYIYVGPRNEKDLKKYSVAENNGFGISGKKIVDAVSSSSFLGWLEFIFKEMMKLIYRFIPNWGVSIIIMTIILKILLFPLTLKSSLGTLKMQEIQPRMQAIQNKYKDNPAKLQEETSKLYKETGYNPVSGCLPLIFQMFALYAMFMLFNNYFEFRGAGFVKGWIDDLSVGDSILSWKPNIPFIGNDLRILPIIYLFSQLFYGKITQMGGAASAGQSAGTMKFMTYGLPIIFSVMFYNAPAGLLLFWTVSNIIQMGQQLIINKVMAKKKAEQESANSNIKKFPKKKGKK